MFALKDMNMKEYYSMVNPRLSSDWGEIILVDKRVSDFLEKSLNYKENGDTLSHLVEEFINYDECEEFKNFKNTFSIEDWDFLKHELCGLNQTDKEFLIFNAKEWEPEIADNYYALKDLDSTIHFHGVTDLFNYINKNPNIIKIIGDLL